MRTPIFVFLGHQSSKTEDNLSLLHEKLNDRLNKIVPSLKAFRQNNLLSIRHENVSIYASIITEQKEISDWTKMANNFELTVDLNNLNEVLINERLESTKAKFPEFYKDIHYSLARETFVAMRNIQGLTIYAFL